MAFYGLTDADEPIDILDREIYYSLSQNIIVQEDNISQLLTFRVNKIDEGIDLSTKSWYFDYINPKDSKLYNIPIDLDTKEEQTLETEEYLLIKVPVVAEMTKTAGSLQFALSAIDENGDFTKEDDATTSAERQYIWQTKPSILTIVPNLGERNTAAISNPDSATKLETLITDIDALSQDVSSIMESDVYNMDNGDSDNGEVILTGGDASTEEA